MDQMNRIRNGFVIILIILFSVSCGLSTEVRVEPTAVYTVVISTDIPTPSPTSTSVFIPVETYPELALSDRIQMDGQSFIWVWQFDTDLSDKFNDMVCDVVGNAYILVDLGQATDYGSGLFQKVLKFDPEGEFQWEETIGTYNGNSLDLTLAANNAGDVFSGGESGGGFESLFSGKTTHLPTVIRKFSPAGELQWEAELLGGQCTKLGDIAVDDEGNVFAAGGKRSGGDCGEDSYAFIEGLDNAGESSWALNLGPDMNELTLSITSNPEGGFSIAGSIDSDPEDPPRFDWDLFVRRYTQQGEEIWSTQFGSEEADYIKDIVSDDQGSSYVLYETEYPFLIKFDANGQQVWHKQLDDRETGKVSLTINPEGDLILLLNFDWPYIRDEQTEIRKIDSQGNLLWIRQFPSNWPAVPEVVGVDPEGYIYIGGSANGALSEGTEFESGIFLLKIAP
jgi:hypothetical protein